MSNFEEVQATEQALREQNQLLRKQLEEMNMQMQALMAQMQGNMTAQSSQATQETQQPDVEQAIPPAPVQPTVHINVPQPEPVFLPPMAAPVFRGDFGFLFWNFVGPRLDKSCLIHP
jgi:hypothetical protein